MAHTPIVERAFQIAGGGLGPTDIRVKLRNEGYPSIDISMHLTGQAITAALKRAAKTARTGP